MGIGGTVDLNCGHVWADRFEGVLDDVFELQDRITQGVAALEARLDVWREVRCGANAPSGCTSITTKVGTLCQNFAKHTHGASSRMSSERALAINCTFTPALALLGFVLTDQARFGWEKDEATTYEAALKFAARALVITRTADAGPWC